MCVFKCWRSESVFITNIFYILYICSYIYKDILEGFQKVENHGKEIGRWGNKYSKELLKINLIIYIKIFLNL